MRRMISAIALVGAVWAGGCSSSSTKSSEPLERPRSDMSSGGEAVIPAEETARHAGQTVTVEYTIAGVGQYPKICFLNSKPWHRGSTDFVAVIFSKDKPEFAKVYGEDLKAALEGKKVRIKGEITMYKKEKRGDKDDDDEKGDKDGDAQPVPEIILKSPDQLHVIQ